MFERIKRLYKEHRLDETGLLNAVSKRLITEEQRQQILAEGRDEH